MAVTPAATSSIVEDRVIDIVAGLVAELAGTGVGRPTLDDSLDRELRITSLERVELLLRLEQAFGVRLPDSVMAEAATPQDLVTAILHAAPPVAESARPVQTIAQTPSVQAAMPTAARSLVEALRWHAERTPHSHSPAQ